MIQHFELAIHISDIDDENDFDSIQEAILEKYDIDIDSFDNLINDLLPLCMASPSPLTGQLYQGFADIKNKGGVWLSKIKLD